MATILFHLIQKGKYDFWNRFWTQLSYFPNFSKTKDRMHTKIGTYMEDMLVYKFASSEYNYLLEICRNYTFYKSKKFSYNGLDGSTQAQTFTLFSKVNNSCQGLGRALRFIVGTHACSIHQMNDTTGNIFVEIGSKLDEWKG